MRVGEAKQRDIGKKRARIGPDAMDYLQVTPGDVIQINAKRSAYRKLLIQFVKT